MPDPGVLPAPQMAQGAAELERMHRAGFSTTEIGQYKQDQINSQRLAGFKPSEISDYWGDKPPSSPTITNTLHSSALETALNISDQTGQIFKTAVQNFTAPIAGAWGDLQTQQTDNWEHTFHPSNADLASPIMGQIRAAKTLWSASNVVFSPVSGVANTVMHPLGQAAGASGLPFPKFQIDLANPTNGRLDWGAQWQVHMSLEHGDQAGEDWGNLGTGVASTLMLGTGAHGAIEAAKGGEPVVPAATRAAVVEATRSGELKDPGDAAAAIVGQGNVTPAMRAAMPSHQDYQVAALHIWPGAPTATALDRVVSNMQVIWQRTGMNPTEQMLAGGRDPVLHAEMISQDPTGDPVTPAIRTFSKTEPKPLVPPPPDRVDDTAAQAHDALHHATVEESAAQADAARHLQGATPAAALDPKFVAQRQAHNEELAQTKAARLKAQADVEKLPPAAPTYVSSVDGVKGLITQLEGGLDKNGNARVSKAFVNPLTGKSEGHGGAVGEYQITLGLARSWVSPALRNLSDSELQAWLSDRHNNETLANTIISHYYAEFGGNSDAVLVAWNHGEAGARKFLTKGPGTRLEAIPDKGVRGGIRYVSVSAARDESFLPRETQEYLANGRRHAGGKLSEAPPGAAPELPADPYERPDGRPIPSTEPEPTTEEETNEEGTVIRMGGIGANVLERSTREALDGVGENLGEGPRSSSSALETATKSADAAADQMFGLNPFRRLDTELVKQGLIDRETDFTPGEDAQRQATAGASGGRADLFIKGGIVDGPEGKNVIPDSPDLHTAGKQMVEDGGNAGDLQKTMVAHRAVELSTRFIDQANIALEAAERALEENPDDADAQAKASAARAKIDAIERGDQEEGIETGINLFDARQIVEDKDHNSKYDRARATMKAVFDGALDYVAKSGRYSVEQVAAMKALNVNWISFRRVMGDDDSFKLGISNGKFGLGNPLRAMEGSMRNIINPLLSSVDNMRLMIQSADQNWARGKLVALAETNPKAALDIGLMKVENHPVSTEEIDAAFEPYRKSMSEDEFEATKQAAQTLVDARAEKKLAPNQFTYYRDGVRETWQIADPGVAKALRAATSSDETLGIMKVAQGFASMQRAGVTWDIVTRNIVSHQFIQWLQSPMKPPPFMASIKGFMDVVKLSDVYKDAQAKGALVGGMVAQDRNELLHSMKDAFGEQGVDLAKGVTPNHGPQDLGSLLGQSARMMNNVFVSPFRAARWLTERGDAMNRVGLYKMGIERGMDPQKAAMLARKAGIDYAEPLGHAAINSWAKITPFSKADMLYMKQAAEAPGGITATKLTAYAAGQIGVKLLMPTVALWAINRFQDQFLPDDQKSTNIERWRKDYGAVGPRMYGVRPIIRYPPVVGFFPAMLTRTLDALADHDPHAMDDWMNTFLKQPPFDLTPYFGDNPAIVSPLMDNMTNHNPMTGSTMIPESLKGASTWMQATPNTSAIARALSKVISPLTDQTPFKAQFSPIALDHLASSWGGVAGSTVASILGLPFPDRAAKPWSITDNPITQSLVIKDPGMNGEFVDNFYADKAKFDTAKADWAAGKRELLQGDNQDMKAVAAEQRWAQADGLLTQAAHNINLARDAIVAIERDPHMSDSEKLAHIEPIQLSAVRQAQGYSKFMQAFDPDKDAQ
jgi:Large polyvalent protein associated domain 38